MAGWGSRAGSPISSLPCRLFPPYPDVYKTSFSVPPPCPSLCALPVCPGRPLPFPLEPPALHSSSVCHSPVLYSVALHLPCTFCDSSNQWSTGGTITAYSPPDILSESQSTSGLMCCHHDVHAAHPTASPPDGLASSHAIARKRRQFTTVQDT